jgi:hypothetical protein
VKILRDLDAAHDAQASQGSGQSTS